MILKGTFRIYFNRHQAAPLVWCIALMPSPGSPDDPPLWELAVKSFTILARTVGHYVPKPVDDAEDGKPSAWLGARGTLSVNADGHACIRADDWTADWTAD